MPRIRSERGEPQLTLRADIWQISYYDEHRRRMRTLSTGERDRVAATRKLAEFIVRGSQPKPVEPEAPRGKALDPIQPTMRFAPAAAHHAPAAPVELSSVGIVEVVQDYHDIHARKQAQAPEVLRTIKHLKNFFSDDTLDLLWGDAGESYVQEYVNWRAEMPRVTSVATIKRDIDILRAALNALRRGNPGLLVPDFPSLPQTHGRIIWITKEQAQALLASCSWEHTRIFCELAMATGARSGALFELEWSQVDLAGGTLDLQPEGCEETNKRKPIVPIAGRLLVRLKQLREDNKGAKHVLEIDGKRIASNIRKSFATAVKAAGLDPRKVTPNTLRHSVASWMVQAGRPLKEVADFLGHADIRMVERHYGHLDPNYKRAAVEVLNEVLPDAETPQYHRKWEGASRLTAAKPLKSLEKMVDPSGIEPLTSTMPLWRSPS